jgi:hypothetical protein
MRKKLLFLISFVLALCLVNVAFVWGFTTIPYIVIDDFESYASDPCLYAVWKDRHFDPNNAAEAYIATDPCHGPIQSMELSYDWAFDDIYYCELIRTYDNPQDFSEGGLAALWLWFYGDANDIPPPADGMYVTLGDDDNGDGTVDDKATIYYGDPRTINFGGDGDANDLIAKEWIEWGFSLQDFNEANNVNPDKIKQISIGLTGGDSGSVYFDDIRLYVPRCIPEYTRQFGNIFDPEEGLDCLVDEADLELMGDEWLTSGIKADIVDDDNVNFKDYDILASSWLERFLWP